MLIKVRRFFSALFHWLFPRQCYGCGAPDHWACPACLGYLPSASRPDDDWINAVFPYKERVIRKAIWSLKFAGKHSVLDDFEIQLQKTLTEMIEARGLWGEKITLVPIPLTARSKKTRAYNQSLLIAKRLARVSDNIAIADNLLKKKTNHLSQNKIKNKTARMGNVKGSFIVNKSRDISGVTIIIIDDVVTTGATMKEARKALLAAGAKHVFGFAIAH